MSEVQVRHDRHYTTTHQWVRKVAADRYVVGFTEVVYTKLDAILHFELAEVGDHLEAEEVYGIIQSLAGPLQELPAPVAGRVVAVNDELLDDPDEIFVLDDPYGDGWMIEIAPDDPAAVDALLSAEDYLQRGGI